MWICSQCGHENPESNRFCGACGAPLASGKPTREVRKTVTVLFCDVTGSTALGESLDAESLRALLARYFEQMRAIVELHGGTVEKFIGDAVMAVFGVPRLHEDDALRALRAAVEMRDALPELGVQGRIGVATGEVVTGTEERLATGDVVNVAARLQQAAQPGEVLVGYPTVELVRDAVVLEPVGPLDLRGKGTPVNAYLLRDVREVPERLPGTAFVGRARELGALGDAWERVRTERRCGLVTIVGDAGVGKSRLVAEFVRVIDATVARGRCLPYGEGITYWPVVEVLKQLDTVSRDPAMAAPIQALLGKTAGSTSADELAWAFRKTLEQAAAERPLVVVFDDIQWGEQTFLDLVEHVALLSSGAPVLLVCMARPELGERRPEWPVALRLDGLGAADVDALMPAGMPGELRGRIVRAAGGNPLFVEEMVAVAAEAEGEVVVPATLRALLGARLDQLAAGERGVLERAAVEGEVFHRGAVQALTADGSTVTPSLAALVRRQLIRPERPQLAGEDGFRFRHLLIRDAAYDSLSKAARAELHLGFAAWLERRGGDLVELDEIVGYHLEQALGYHAELGLPRDDELAAAACRHLRSAGWRANFSRLDYGAAVSLLARAAAALPPGHIDLEVEIILIDAFFWAGDTDNALRRAESLVERGRSVDDLVAELCGRIKAGYVRLYVEPEGVADHLQEEIEQALPVFHAAENRIALYVAYNTLAWVAHFRGRWGEALQAVERAVEYVPEAAGDILGWGGGSRLDGATPLLEVLAWLDEQEQHQAWHPWLAMFRAVTIGMLGRTDEARRLMAETCAALADRGSGFEMALFTARSAEIELLAGDPATAADFVTEACRQLESLGHLSFLSTQSAWLAQILCALDRLDDVDEQVNRARRLGASDDVETQHRWRQAKAVALARRGGHPEAETLARQAVAMADTTDNLNNQAEAYADLAQVLALGGKANEATGALREALGRYDRKGNLVMSRRIGERLTSMPATGA